MALNKNGSLYLHIHKESCLIHQIEGGVTQYYKLQQSDTLALCVAITINNIIDNLFTG